MASSKSWSVVLLLSARIRRTSPRSNSLAIHWWSASMSSVRNPSEAKHSAIATALVVLATPPLRLMRRMIGMLDEPLHFGWSFEDGRYRASDLALAQAKSGSPRRQPANEGVLRKLDRGEVKEVGPIHCF